jgi:hypothetical protein
MAARIEKVEKEFILMAAAESALPVLIQAAGRSLSCRLSGADQSLLRFSPSKEESSPFRAWETVSARFDFRGQPMAFTTKVRRSGQGLLELASPEIMYRDLLRRWPRVQAPRGFSARLLLPGFGLSLSCPESREYAEVEEPEANFGAPSLAALAEEFRRRAAELSDEYRVIMFKDGRGPADAAEGIASALGRVVFVPSTASGLPIVDPYPEGRLVTQSDLEDFEGPLSLAGDSALGGYLASRAHRGLIAALWCPILYYRYVIGLVYLGSSTLRPFDLRAVDFAYGFSRSLAWSLKRYGYFEATAPQSDLCPASLIDLSPSGLLLSLGRGMPVLKPSATLDLVLESPLGEKSLKARVARHFSAGKEAFYGLAFEALPESEASELANGLYGIDSDIGAKGGFC